MPAPGTTVKSDERRRAVLQAAVDCFARRGLYGTTTHQIADAAGISQPYIYRLFSTKEALFVGAVEFVSDLLADALSAQAAMVSPDAPAADALRAARDAYTSLIEDRSVMMFLMHANCAAHEPLIGDAVRSCYAKQVELVRDMLHHDEELVRQWFGAGMLDNVVTALDLVNVDETWAQTLRGS